MRSLKELRSCIAALEIRLTEHAFMRMAERNISVRELSEAGSTAELIENYPFDRISASCLLLGFTDSDRPLHFQVSRSSNIKVTVITIYDPDPNEWIEWRQRR